MKQEELTLVEATWAPIASQIRAKSMQVKQSVYDGLNPSQQALYLVEILRGHSAHGVRHMLGVLEPALAQPAAWPAIRAGFAFFGAQRMLDLLPAIQALHGAPEAESATVDALLPTALDEALHLVAAYIRSHPTEFAPSITPGAERKTPLAIEVIRQLPIQAVSSMKKFLSRLLIPLLLLTLISSPTTAEPPITVWLDGVQVPFDVAPAVTQGRTLVPLRAIFEALGATVTWDQATQTATAIWADAHLTLPSGAAVAELNGQKRPLDVPAQVVGGRTLVPLRFVAETLGAQVGWYGQSRVITINRPLNLIEAKVISVTDGDTLQVQLPNGTTEKVRLIGVDTPETVHPTKGVEFYGPEASAFTKERLAGQSLRLELDAQERDQYGRLLAYAYLPSGAMFNAILADEGYARQATFPPNVRYVDLFGQLARSAQTAGVGLWQEAPEPAVAEVPNQPAPGTLRYDPFGPDRNCDEFSSQAEAQAFYVAAGGPNKDPHRLDSDRDGIACESLR